MALLTTGNANIAVGTGAGANLTTGSNNIDIGNIAPSNESNTIRIGNSGHTRFFATGIYAIPVAGSAVTVNSLGQLGVVPSSRRFKEDVRDMAQSSSGLRSLRPVTFYYKEGPRELQYGLIAEEVASVYPELVDYSETGEPYTVRYHVLGSMLLNELQSQDRQIQAQAAQIAQLEAGRKRREVERREQEAQIAALRAELKAIANRVNRLDR
jgi:hypothetical protein